LSPPYQATPYPSTIEIKDTVGTIQSLEVVLGTLNHSYSRDIAIMLVGPSKSIILMDKVGDGPLGSVKLTFSDAGATINPTVPLGSGVYKPYSSGTVTYRDENGNVMAATASTFADFAGSSANGKWKLYVLDTKPFDAGTLGSWTMNIQTTPTFTISQKNIKMTENGTTNVTITLKDSSTAEGTLKVTAKAGNTTLFPTPAWWCRLRRHSNALHYSPGVRRWHRCHHRDGGRRRLEAHRHD